MPQIGVSPMLADPNLSQCYHAVMNVALMDGSVRKISAALSQQTWTNALNPSDGQVLGDRLVASSCRRIVRLQPLDQLDSVAVRIADEKPVRVRNADRFINRQAVLSAMFAGGPGIVHSQGKVPG